MEIFKNEVIQAIQAMQSGINNLSKKVGEGFIEINERFDRVDVQLINLEKRMDDVEDDLRRQGLLMEDMRDDLGTLVDGQVMLYEKIDRIDERLLRVEIA